MASKDAAHHACLDRILVLYACHQRILRFTPWNVNIWCIVSEVCETSRIWWYLMNTQACEETNGAKRCSTSHLLTSCPEIISTSSNNILICSFGCTECSNACEVTSFPYTCGRRTVQEQPRTPPCSNHAYWSRCRSTRWCSRRRLASATADWRKSHKCFWVCAFQLKMDVWSPSICETLRVSYNLNLK